MRYAIRFCITVLAALLWAAAPAQIVWAQQEADRPSAPQSNAASALLDEVWRTVRDHFYDPSLRGLDWSAVRERYEPAVLAAESDAARAALINAMLTELGASHTNLYIRDDPAYYQIADIFSGKLRREGLSRVFPSGEVTYPGI